MAVLLSSLAAGPLCGQCGYEVTAIVQAPPCGFTGPAPSTPFAINDAGVIAGRYFQCVESGFEAFTYSPTEGFTTLPRPPDSLGAQALDVNNTGWVVGCVEIGTGHRCEAALWRRGEVTLLGIPPGGNFSVASGVNDIGVIVGWWGNTATGDPARAAFRWVGGVMTTLELPIGSHTVAADVNEAGAITGWMGQSLLIDALAFVYEGESVTNLGVIPGGVTSIGEAINSSGDVAGWGLIPDDKAPFGLTRAFLWTSGQMVDLGVLPDRLRSGASDMNDAGQIVGRSWDVGGNPNIGHSFIWQNGLMHNVNDLIAPEEDVSVTSAVAINDAGQIAAQESGTSDSVLLSPIPVPGDIDGDCHAGVEDLMILIDAFGQSGSPADLNGDGVVNVLDLIILLLNFGS